MHAHDHMLEDVFETRATMCVDTAADEPGGGAPSNLCVTDSLNGIGKISAKGKNVLLYFWSPSDELREQIAKTRFSSLPSFSKTVAKADLAGLPNKAPDDLTSQILTELTGVLTVFAELLPTNAVRVEFCKTAGRSCPLFHVDRVSFRMLCTLRGPGTEWLADGAVNRKRLGQGDNRKVTKQGALVYEVAPFQVCILKGEAHVGSAGAGAVHRSPAVPDTIDGRWYVRVDAV